MATKLEEVSTKVEQVGLNSAKDGVLSGIIDFTGTLKKGGVAITASAAEINQAATVSTKNEIVTATNVITASENSKTFFLNSATEFVSTLPAVAIGLRFEFIVTAAPSGASYTIVTDSSANVIKGQVYSTDVNSATDPDFETSGGDTISFVDGKAVAGDRVVVVSDGTNWFAWAFCSVFDAIIITTAS